MHNNVFAENGYTTDSYALLATTLYGGQFEVIDNTFTNNWGHLYLNSHTNSWASVITVRDNEFSETQGGVSAIRLYMNNQINKVATQPQVRL